MDALWHLRRKLARFGAPAERESLDSSVPGIRPLKLEPVRAKQQKKGQAGCKARIASLRRGDSSRWGADYIVVGKGRSRARLIRISAARAILEDNQLSALVE